MLHASVLPHEDLWRRYDPLRNTLLAECIVFMDIRRFLKNLKLVAVDELHYYTGIFGRWVAPVHRADHILIALQPCSASHAPFPPSLCRSREYAAAPLR